MACDKMQVKGDIFLFDNPSENLDGFEAEFMKMFFRFPEKHSCREYLHLQKNNRMTVTMQDLNALFVKEKLQQSLEIKETRIKNKL